MKWFKHISDSLDDPFIFSLMDKFGDIGYLVFFGVLEIYAREFKPELNWKLNVTRAYLRQKLHKRQDTLIINCLKHIKNSGKWQIEFKDEQVIIFIPKFTQLIDEWTKRKLRSYSEPSPEILTPDKEEDKDKEEDIKENKQKKSNSRFRKPTIPEITDYCFERKNNVNPEQFFDHYEAKGWKIGKSPMKDWQAAVRTWEKNGKQPEHEDGITKWLDSKAPEESTDIEPF